MEKINLEALKQNCPILEVLQSLSISVSGNRFRCLRPERHTHQDRTPSVSVWPDRGQFKCWVCDDVKGDVIDLVKLAKGCSFREAIEYLGQGRTDLSTEVPYRRSGSIPPSQKESNSKSLQIPLPLSSPQSPKIPVSVPDSMRKEVMLYFLRHCVPVHGKAATYLKSRRVFKKTWDKQKLRMVEDYAHLSRSLMDSFALETLVASGLFNTNGHLRFYRHPLIFPYLDSALGPVYLQARAVEETVAPKELSLKGRIPVPYNMPLLDGSPGLIYLCEGVIDTLTLLEQGFPAVGVPGATNFKAEWAPLFRNKTVYVAFDQDGAGMAGAAKTMDALEKAGVNAKRQSIPEGLDVNDLFRGRKPG